MLQNVGEDRPLLSGDASSTSSAASATDSPDHAGVESQLGTGKHRGSTASSSSAEGELGLVSGPLERTVEATVLPETSHLGRHLSWHSAFILVISRVIGSGIFATPGAVVRSAGSIGLSLTIWTAGAVLAACGLGVSLELGCMLPRSGGDKVYLEFIYRRPRFLASTLVAVNAVLLGFTASNCVVFSEYLLFAFKMETPSDLLRKGLAVGLLTVITVVHGCTPKAGVAIQNVLGWFKVGLVLFMVFAGLFVVIFNPGQTDARNGRGHLLDWDYLWRDSDWSWGTIATSLFKVFYSYAGLSNMNNVLNDVKDPVRTYKSVSLSALVTALLLYTLVNVAYFMVVPLEEIKSSGELIAALFFERTFGPNLGRRILPLAVALSAGGNVMVVTYALARLNQEIARQGFLPWPELLASTKPFNAPLGALIVHYIPSILVIALPPSNQVYSFILEVEGYPAQFFSLAVSGGLLWLRHKRPDLRRPFKVWTGAVVLRMVMSLGLIAAPFFPPQHHTGTVFYATYALVGVAILLFAGVYWYVWTVLLPHLKGYRLEEKDDVLDDGVAITRLVKVPVRTA